MNEISLHEIVKEFDAAARSANPDQNAPATIADLNHLVTQVAVTLDKLIAELTQQ